MLTFLITAAEPSKTPFYIAGGLLAIYGVALAAVGLTRPSFPGNGAGVRMVMGLSFVLMLVAVAAAVTTDP